MLNAKWKHTGVREKGIKFTFKIKLKFPLVSLHEPFFNTLNTCHMQGKGEHEIPFKSLSFSYEPRYCDLDRT